MSRFDVVVTDLLPGDVIHRLGQVTFAAALDADAPPVLACAVEPGPGPAQATVTTSAGAMVVAAESRVRGERDHRVRAGAVLLISRRPGLHARLSALGVPVVRRSPRPDDRTAEQVTADEWRRAPLIVLDAFLSPQTLTTLVGRRGFTERHGVVMVCTEPDDISVPAREHLAGATGVLLLPHDEDTLNSLFNVAARTGRSRDAFPSILGANA